MDVYEIKLEGRLDKRWADWFSNLKIEHVGGYTILCGPVADQSALHGYLIKIRDLNMTIISLAKRTQARPPPEK